MNRGGMFGNLAENPMEGMMKERFTSRRLETIARPRYFYEYFVTGRGEFPVDMLRYDCCWPATGSDAALLDDQPVSIDKPSRENRSVRMHSYREPTIDRWSSFGWSVGTENLNPK